MTGYVVAVGSTVSICIWPHGHNGYSLLSWQSKLAGLGRSWPECWNACGAQQQQKPPEQHFLNLFDHGTTGTKSSGQLPTLTFCYPSATFATVDHPLLVLIVKILSLIRSDSFFHLPPMIPVFFPALAEPACTGLNSISSGLPKTSERDLIWK